ncbi:hypothetical protein HPB49_007323 [Dermacentor silvarum]|uniref:Uncharacterized protein n=1 Tax=Dermacentor silvarum TaxID=543639 RepID=A0ACB8D3G1_DERSI|nr:hypothetical protein HPB49_007323 [Dermacentor silvarum]
MSSEFNSADLTIVINTDGSPLYKSSNASIWPIQFIVNELPPRERLQHVGLGGLWFGTRHPDMLLFLDKFVDKVRNIGTLTWQHASRTVTSAVHVVCCSVDSPARALVCNQLQFNGHFGCQWCLTCGQHEQGAFRYVDTEPAQERVSLGILKDMKRALELQIPVNGLKGLSPLVNLPGFDLVHGQAVEYMHCILLGVTRQITDYWFDPSNSQEDFYIGSSQSAEPRCVEHCPSKSGDPPRSPCEDSSSSGSESEPDADLEPDNRKRQYKEGWKDELGMAHGGPWVRFVVVVVQHLLSCPDGCCEEPTSMSFRLIDVSNPGRLSDGGIFKDSPIGKRLEKGELGFPRAAQLPESCKSSPHVFIGDEAIQLRPDFMRPLPGSRTKAKDIVFNCRLSRAM